jgi:hypothetical protein
VLHRLAGGHVVEGHVQRAHPQELVEQRHLRLARIRALSPRNK